MNWCMHAYLEEKPLFSPTFSPPWRFATHRDPSCGAPLPKAHFQITRLPLAGILPNIRQHLHLLHKICTMRTMHEVLHPPKKVRFFEPKDEGLVHMFFRFQPFIFRGVHCRLQMLHLHGCNIKSIGSIKDPHQDEVQIRPANFSGESYRIPIFPEDYHITHQKKWIDD